MIKFLHVKYGNANTTLTSELDVGAFSCFGDLQLVFVSAACFANYNQAGDEVSKQHSMDEDDNGYENLANKYGMPATI